MKKSLYYGSLAVAAAAVLWSLDVLLRAQLFELPPSVVVFWEHLFGLAVLIPVLLIGFKFSFKPFANLTKKQWVAIIVVSLLSGAGGTVLYTAALVQTQFAPFSIVVLMQQLQPLFAIAAAAIILKETLGKRFWLLTVLALGCAYMIWFPDLAPNFNTGEGTVIGAILALGAAAAWGISTALSKYTLKGVSTLHVTAARFFWTPIFAFIIGIAMGDLHSFTAVTPGMWKYIVAITFSTGMVALALYYYGLKRIPASRSTLIELMWPISALVINYFSDVKLSYTQWIAAIFLLVIMWFVVKNEQVATTHARHTSSS